MRAPSSIIEPRSPETRDSNRAHAHLCHKTCVRPRLRRRYYGGGNATRVNNQSQPLTSEFVSLYLRGRTDGFMLKGGDATAGTLTTMYDGPRPFQPMPAELRGRNSPTMSVKLAACAAGADNQTFRFYSEQPELNGTGIATAQWLRHYFELGTISRALLGSVPPYTRRVVRSTSCSDVSDAGWGL